MYFFTIFSEERREVIKRHAGEIYNQDLMHIQYSKWQRWLMMMIAVFIGGKGAGKKKILPETAEKF